MEVILCWKQQTPLVKYFMQLIGPKRSIVCNTGTTREAADCVLYSTRKEVVNGDYVTVSYEKRIKRCQAIEQFYRHFGAIDRST